MSYTAVTAAGFDNMQWGRRSAAGYLTGGSTNLTAANTGLSASMTRHRGALAADIQLPEPTLVPIPGDNAVIATFQFDSDQPVTFVLEMSVLDQAFQQAISGVTAVTEDGEPMMPFGFSGATRNGLILLFTSDAKSAVSATLNSSGYQNLLLYNCEVSYIGAAFNNRGARVFRYRITANAAANLPDGRAVSAVFSTVSGGVMLGHEFSSVNRVSMACLVGDASEDTITTAYDPVSTGTTKATVETTGFAAATDSSVAANSIVLSAAPGSGKFAIGRYEFVAFE